MSRPDEEESLMCLEERAVKAATCGNWHLAIKLNQEILNLKPSNIGAVNRLGKAYWENGQLKNAKTTFEKALSLDPYNIIATKNLARLKSSKTPPLPSKKTSTKNTAAFLEEPGKTKVVRLVRLASHHILGELGCADEVFLQPRNRFINITDDRGTYLGCFPEDISLRLIKLIKGGNRYQAFIRLVDPKSLHLFVQEVKRGSRFRNTPSFLSLGILITLQTRFLN